jgi:predicted amino acid racemase
MTLIRSPMLSQAKRVIMSADVSCNTEIEVIRRLSQVAQKNQRTHGVILMIELGDRREGIMPVDLMETVRQTLCLPNIVLKGIGTNLACRCGVSPDAGNMAELSALADLIEATFDLKLDIVSGGNSANLEWALSGEEPGRINNLRLGEAILLGCETLHRQPLDGLFTDAFTLVAEVIESKVKPSQPSGTIAQTAFGEAAPVIDRGLIRQSILALGRQDTDPNGLLPPAGIEIMGASSDHLILASDSHALAVGSEVAFQLNYSALVLAMTSPFVTRMIKSPAQHR